MSRNFENIFINFAESEPPARLFENIMLAIRREKELIRARKALFGFLCFLFVSLCSVSLSGAIIADQIHNSGIYYFILTAVTDLGVFSVIWREFMLAIIESLPIAEITAFAASLCVCVFTIRLFLRDKDLLFGYLSRQNNLNLL